MRLQLQIKLSNGTGEDINTMEFKAFMFTINKKGNSGLIREFKLEMDCDNVVDIIANGVIFFCSWQLQHVFSNVAGREQASRTPDAGGLRVLS